jgi:hypothetical protein
LESLILKHNPVIEAINVLCAPLQSARTRFSIDFAAQALHLLLVAVDPAAGVVQLVVEALDGVGEFPALLLAASAKRQAENS